MPNNRSFKAANLSAGCLNTVTCCVVTARLSLVPEKPNNFGCHHDQHIMKSSSEKKGLRKKSFSFTM
jgi:hypothetical protein